MLIDEFEFNLKNIFASKSLDYKYYKGDEGGQWYSVDLKAGLLEVYIASDGEIGINVPSVEDELSFGGCDEVYSDLNIALERVRHILSGGHK